MVDVIQLQAVIAIAEHRSITAAARELGMSQPGLSRLVERLENELDADLFTRGRNGAALTFEGSKLLDFAVATLADYDLLKAAIGGSRRSANQASEILRVVASTTPGEYLLPQIASAFTRVESGISVDPLITDSAGVDTLLLSGEYDVGFSGRRSRQSGLTYRPIARDEIVLAVSASHRLAESGEIDVTDLDNENLLVREGGSGTYRAVAAIFRSAAVALPEASSALSLGSTQAVVSAVASGIGVGFVTNRALEHVPDHIISAVRFAGIPLMRDLYLVSPKTDTPRPVALRFMAFLETWTRDQARQ